MARHCRFRLHCLLSCSVLLLTLSNLAASSAATQSAKAVPGWAAEQRARLLRRERPRSW